jgi:hypothetical protein
VFSWAHFESAAPEVAAAGREQIERFHYVYAGTIRKDGTPRISPVEAHIVRLAQKARAVGMHLIVGGVLIIGLPGRGTPQAALERRTAR